MFSIANNEKKLEDIKVENEKLNEEKNQLRGKLLRFEKTTKVEDGKNTVHQANLLKEIDT